MIFDCFNDVTDLSYMDKQCIRKWRKTMPTLIRKQSKYIQYIIYKMRLLMCKCWILCRREEEENEKTWKQKQTQKIQFAGNSNLLGAQRQQQQQQPAPAKPKNRIKRHERNEAITKRDRCPCVFYTLPTAVDWCCHRYHNRCRRRRRRQFNFDLEFICLDGWLWLADSVCVLFDLCVNQPEFTWTDFSRANVFLCIFVVCIPSHLIVRFDALRQQIIKSLCDHLQFGNAWGK